jgi:hypothetical protein
MSRSSDRHVPRGARTAAILFFVSAVLAVLNAVVWQVGGVESRAIALFRLAVRVAGLILIAAGLLRGAHWAWLAGVVFGGLWVLMGALGVAATFSGDAEVPLYGALFMAASVAIMAAGWILLLTRDVREVYRGR